MNSVERVKAICKDRKIPISKLEKDLGFANGYISQLKKGVFPENRIFLIAEYLSVPMEFLMTGKEKENPRPEAEETDPVKKQLYDMIGRMSRGKLILLLEKAEEIEKF